MAMRCFCPPDRFTPRSSMCVSYPWGSCRMKSCAWATLAAAITSSSLASGLAVADVIAHRAGEQDRLLRHDADVRQQRILLDGADIDPVDFHAARTRDHKSAGSG